MEPSFYKNKKVFVTGHTGFKGSWLCKILKMYGAEVVGYSLDPPTEPSIFKLADIASGMKSITGDIRNLKKLRKCIDDFQPEIVFHLAAQPIVRESYQNPVYTYESNVMGTVNILESIRLCNSVRSVIIVTTDKVYKNNEWSWGYRENDELNGFDPYSNSKSCAELVTSSFINSFFRDREIAISTVRAGNVIGGGDFAKDRIIPDCVRAAIGGDEIIVRNPYSVRPYQHVLEPLMAYLMIAQHQYEDKKKFGNFNIGPEDADCINTGDLVTKFCKKWKQLSWQNLHDGGPHEAGFLKLDCSKLKSEFNWEPLWDISRAIDKVIDWTRCYINNRDIDLCMENQINEYLIGRR